MQGVFILDKFGNPINPGERHTAQYGWESAGVITEVVAAGQAPIDEDKRTDADIVGLVAAKKIIFEPKDGIVAFEFRIRSDGTVDDDLVISLLAAAGIDHYTKIADLTCTQGTQPGDAGYFTDAISPANEDWLTKPRVVAAQDEFIARYVLNTHGYDRFLWVCTDKQNATNIWVETHRV